MVRERGEVFAGPSNSDNDWSLSTDEKAATFFVVSTEGSNYMLEGCQLERTASRALPCGSETPVALFHVFVLFDERVNWLTEHVGLPLNLDLVVFI